MDHRHPSPPRPQSPRLHWSRSQDPVLRPPARRPRSVRGHRLLHLDSSRSRALRRQYHPKTAGGETHVVVRGGVTVVPAGVDGDNECLRGIVQSTDGGIGVSDAYVSPVRGFELCVVVDSVWPTAAALGAAGVVCVQRAGCCRVAGCGCFPGMVSKFCWPCFLPLCIRAGGVLTDLNCR